MICPSQRSTVALRFRVVPPHLATRVQRGWKATASEKIASGAMAMVMAMATAALSLNADSRAWRGDRSWYRR